MRETGMIKKNSLKMKMKKNKLVKEKKGKEIVQGIY